MPAPTPKARRFFAMCEHSPEKARGKCPSDKKLVHEMAQKPAGGYPGKKGRAR